MCVFRYTIRPLAQKSFWSTNVGFVCSRSVEKHELYCIIQKTKSRNLSQDIIHFSYIRTQDQFTNICEEFLKKSSIQQIYVIIKELLFIRLSVYLQEEKLKTKIVLKKDFLSLFLFNSK